MGVNMQLHDGGKIPDGTVDFPFGRFKVEVKTMVFKQSNKTKTSYQTSSELHTNSVDVFFFVLWDSKIQAKHDTVGVQCGSSVLAPIHSIVMLSAAVVKELLPPCGHLTLNINKLDSATQEVWKKKGSRLSALYVGPADIDKIAARVKTLKSL